MPGEPSGRAEKSESDNEKPRTAQQEATSGFKCARYTIKLPLPRAVADLIKGVRDSSELGERCCEVVNDLAGDDLGRQEAVSILQAWILEPGDVEVDFVSSDELVIAERLEPLGLDADVARLARPVALDEVVQTLASQLTKIT